MVLLAMEARRVARKARSRLRAETEQQEAASRGRGRRNGGTSNGCGGRATCGHVCAEVPREGFCDLQRRRREEDHQVAFACVCMRELRDVFSQRASGDTCVLCVRELAKGLRRLTAPRAHQPDSR